MTRWPCLPQSRGICEEPHIELNNKKRQPICGTLIRSLTIAPGDWMTPSLICLEYGPVWGAKECHPFLTSDNTRIWNHSIYCFSHLKVTTACKVVRLPSSHPFGKIPGDPQLISRQMVFNGIRWDCASLASAYWLQPSPTIVPLAPADCLAYDHVAIVTLVQDQGVVGHGVEYHSAIWRVGWDWARHGWIIQVLRRFRLWYFLRLHSGIALGLHDPSAWQYLQYWLVVM